MIFTTKSLYKTLKISIFAAACFGQVCAIKFELLQTIPKLLDTGKSLILPDNTLYSYGGPCGFSKGLFIKKNESKIDLKKNFLVQSLEFNPKYEIFAATIEGNEENNWNANQIVFYDKTLTPFKESSNKNDYVTKKLYFTPNKNYLIALTYPSKDITRANPRINIFECSASNKVLFSAYHEIKLPNDYVFSFPDQDYLLVPDNNHIVYSSGYHSKGDKWFRAFKILRLSPYLPSTPTSDWYKRDEKIYECLDDVLKKCPNTRPLHINPQKGCFFIGDYQNSEIQKFVIQNNKPYKAGSIFTDIFTSQQPIAFDRDGNYAAIGHFQSNLIDVVNLNSMTLLDPIKIDLKDGHYVYSLKFSEGKEPKLTITTSSNIFIVGIKDEIEVKY